jgi:hypothetical protein
VSFDVYLQDFSDEQTDRGDEVHGVLDRLLDQSGSRIVTHDGDAEVYGIDDDPLNGLMFSNVDGDSAWDVIYAVADAANWVVMPVGCPICVLSEDFIETIPEELLEPGVVIVESGEDILRVVTAPS